MSTTTQKTVRQNHMLDNSVFILCREGKQHGQTININIIHLDYKIPSETTYQIESRSFSKIQLKRCRITKVISETNSLSLQNMIQREWRVPWSLIDKKEEIHMIVVTIQIQIVHIFREANQLADCITNIAINQKNRQQYH